MFYVNLAYETILKIYIRDVLACLNHPLIINVDCIKSPNVSNYIILPQKDYSIR